MPLTGRAVDILRGMPQGAGDMVVFPAGSGKDLPLPAQALIEALREQAWTQTVHGFRSAFRDWAGEPRTFRARSSRRRLPTAVGDATETAYRRGDAIEKRRKLMEAWSRYCAEKPAEGGKVVPMQGRA